MTEFCRNLQIVKRVSVDDEMFQPENFSKLLNLSYLVHLECFSFTANPATISVLNQLPCLKFVNFSDLILDVGEIDENEAPNTNQTDYPKLNISCLKIGTVNLNFWRVVRLETLQKLAVGFGSRDKFLKFREIVNLCPNLREVETCLHLEILQQYDQVSELISTVESLPKFQELVLVLEISLDDLENLVKNCPQISKYTHAILILSPTFKQKDFATIFRLKHLRKMYFFVLRSITSSCSKICQTWKRFRPVLTRSTVLTLPPGFCLASTFSGSVFMKLLLSIKVFWKFDKFSKTCSILY